MKINGQIISSVISSFSQYVKIEPIEYEQQQRAKK